MPVVLPGRAAPLRVSVGLIVCLAGALAAAGPPLVPPDEAAGLRPVAEMSSDADEIDTLEPACVGLTDFVSCRERPSWHSANAPSMRNATESVPYRMSALDQTEFFADASLPPVVRSQSPDIELLPLARGEVPIENTSLLRTVTGTKGRLRGDYLTDFGGTDRIGVQALTEGWFGLGLDAEANYWQRPVPGVGREPLWTGDLNLIYNLFPHPRYKFRSGLGASWLIDDGEPRAGYNITHGLDVYLLWRFMATGEIDWGKMDDEDLFRYRVALGLTFEFCEIYSGYESYKLGGEKLDGWVNGVAFWY